jgi:hypothetical protein
MVIMYLVVNISPTCASPSEARDQSPRYSEIIFMRRFILPLLLAAVLAGASSTSVLADDPCTGFKWDVSREHALFGGSAASVIAGKDTASAPAIATDHLYELKLTPQTQVSFARPPGKTMLTDGAFAGLVTFRVTAPGAYRVAVDVPFWIDVVADGRLVATKDFQGAHGCDAPHKIVEYELAAAQPLMLQVSGSTQAVVRLTVTASPAAHP